MSTIKITLNRFEQHGFDVIQPSMELVGDVDLYDIIIATEFISSAITHSPDPYGIVTPELKEAAAELQRIIQGVALTESAGEVVEARRMDDDDSEPSGTLH